MLSHAATLQFAIDSTMADTGGDFVLTAVSLVVGHCEQLTQGTKNQVSSLVSGFLLAEYPRSRWNQDEALRRRWMHWLSRFGHIQTRDVISMIRRHENDVAVCLHQALRARGPPVWRCNAPQLDREALQVGNATFLLWHLEHCVHRDPWKVVPLVAESGSMEVMRSVCTEWWQQKRQGLFPVHVIKKTLWVVPREHRIEVLQLFHELQADFLPKHLLDDAATHGDQDMFDWVIQHRTGSVSSATMDKAAANGHLSMVQWLHQNFREGCSVAAMNGAASLGHLQVVEWLHLNRTEGCTTAAIDMAAANGHLMVVQWLLENRNEGCTSRAMDQGAGNGHLAVVQRLHQAPGMQCTTKAMDLAAANGHLEMVQWLHDNRSEGCTADAMQQAAANGHLNVVQWFHMNRPGEQTSAIMDQAASNGHIEVAEWLGDAGFSCSENAMVGASQSKHWSIMRWLCVHQSEIAVSALENAASTGQLQGGQWFSDQPDEWVKVNLLNQAITTNKCALVQWLYENRPQVISPEAMALAVSSDIIEIVQRLYEINPALCSTKMMNQAAALGRIRLVEFFQENVPNICTASAMDLAATNGHVNVVRFLHRNHQQCTTEALMGAIDNRHSSVVEFIYPTRFELRRWPERQHTRKLLRLLQSDNDQDQAIMRFIATQRLARYRYEATFTYAHEASNVAQSSVGMYIFRVMRYLPDQVPDALWKMMSAFLGGDVSTRWSEWDAVSRGWLHWLEMFSEIHHRHLVHAAECSNWDAVQRIHGHLAADGRLECDSEFIELLLARSDPEIVRWHLDQCSEVAVHEYVFLATWAGRWDVLEMLSAYASLIDEDAVVGHSRQIQVDHMASVDDAVKNGDLEQLLQLRLSGVIAEVVRLCGTTRHTMVAPEWIDPALVTLKQMQDVFLRNLEQVEGQLLTPMELAARYGNFEIAQYLVRECRDECGCTPNAVDLAATLGHLDIVLHLVEQLGVLATISGFYGAIINRHHDVVQYLFDVCPLCRRWPRDEDGEALAQMVAEDGNNDVYRFFQTHRRMQLSPAVIDYFLVECCTPQREHFQRRDFGNGTTLPMDLAAANGDLSEVRWYHENGHKCSVLAMNGAAEGDHLEVVVFLHEYCEGGCTRDAMDLAAKNGHLNVVYFLNRHRKEGCSPYALYWATCYGHTDVVSYLLKNDMPGNPDVCLSLAMTRGGDGSDLFTYYIFRKMASILRKAHQVCNPRPMSTAQLARRARQIQRQGLIEEFPDDEKLIVLERLAHRFQLCGDASEYLRARNLFVFENFDVDTTSNTSSDSSNSADAALRELTHERMAGFSDSPEDSEDSDDPEDDEGEPFRSILD